MLKGLKCQIVQVIIISMFFLSSFEPLDMLTNNDSIKVYSCIDTYSHSCNPLSNNYNCHNIYWTPLIWLVKNGHLLALNCISFFNEPGPYSWGAGPFTTELLLWYCAMLLWRDTDSLQLLTLYLTLRSTLTFSGGKAKINLHTTPKLKVVMLINCLLRSIPLPSLRNDAITSCNFACFPATLLYVLSWAPQ